MSNKRRGTWLLTALAVTAGVSMMVAAYGIAANKTTTTPQQSQKALGTLRAVIDTIDYLDPQQSYTAQSVWAMWNVYTTLVTYRHVDGPGGFKIVPGLAASLPTVSRNGRVYSFKLRKGLRYSNGKPVKASDFKYAIKREYLSTGQGVAFYRGIAGAAKFEKALKGDIPGIRVNNQKRTITIRLATPRGDFLTVLGLGFAAPVPAGTPPAIQNGTIPSTGPYRISNYTVNQGFTLVRNKYFKPTKYVPRGNPNRVQVSLIGDANAALQRVIGGDADYTNAAIPPDRLATVGKRGHLVLHPTAPANTYYFWMNVNVSPFNKLKVRQAVNYALDRKAMQRIVWGGLGKATQNVLPPSYPSYKKLKLYSYNLTKARQLLNQSGVDKSQKVTVWARAVSDSQDAATYYQGQLRKMGFTNVVLNILPRSTYYTTIGNVQTKAQTGWARWLEDYPHPIDWFDVLLNGQNIVEQDNNNYAYFNNKKINREISTLKAAPLLTPSVNAGWTRVEEHIMKQAPWAPWSNRVWPEFFTKKIGCIHLQPLFGVDFVRLCRK
jgi:peptide/nickel transport system substrate-binding protein